MSKFNEYMSKADADRAEAILSLIRKFKKENEFGIPVKGYVTPNEVTYVTPPDASDPIYFCGMQMKPMKNGSFRCSLRIGDSKGAYNCHTPSGMKLYLEQGENGITLTWDETGHKFLEQDAECRKNGSVSGYIVCRDELRVIA